MTYLLQSGILRIAVAIVATALVGGAAAMWVERDVNADLRSMSDAVWWAFVTLTTVGYGDRVPATLAGRVIGIGLAFAGVVLAALLTGRIASTRVERSLREGRGMTDLSQLKNHFVICGWKVALDALLRDLVAIDPSLGSEQFVLIAAVDPAKVEAVRSQADFRQLHFVSGDPLEDAVLARANVSHARRILILADDTGAHSPAEADARTVMTVITVAELAPEAYICAELLDPKYQKQLEAAGADEMILTQHNSRVLLANAAVGTGISGIFYALMTGESGGGLITASFSPEFVGRPFRELRKHYVDADGSLLVGLVENTGNVQQRKREALREAQRTPDVSQLVENLRRVKHVEPNVPVLNPADDYVIPRHSLAILIQRGPIVEPDLRAEGA